MKLKRPCLILIMVTAFLGTKCQVHEVLSTHNNKAIKYYEQAAEYYNARQNQNALVYLLKAIDEDTTFIEAQAMLGYVYDDMNNFAGAAYQYKRVLSLNPDFHPEIYLELAEMEVKQEKYEDAKAHTEQFLATGKGATDVIEKARELLTNCEFAAVAIKNPVPFNPVNMGTNINSRYDDYFPTMTVDGSMILFTRNINMGDPRDPSFGDFNEDFYISYKKGGEWLKAFNAGPPLNTNYNEGAPTLSADGTELIFTGCDRPEGFGSCDLYYSFWKNGNWSRARNLGKPVNSRNWETQPCLSSDGTSLYYIIGVETADGVKHGHIYETTLDDSGNWCKPVRLSDTINTKGREECPFIADDNNTLYFCSSGHPGFGGTDIFVSKRLPNGRWGIPKNLGYPINSSKDETGIMIDPNGQLAYFASDRPGGYGGLDIYYFPLYDSIKPEPVTYFKGTIFDAKTKYPLQAYFDLIDLSTGKMVTHSISKTNDGTFLICLPTNRNYALNVHKKGYLFYSDNFSLKEIAASYDHPFLKDIPLQPIDTGSNIVLKNVFFETGKYALKPESEIELNKLVSFLTLNPTLKIQLRGFTDNVFTHQSNLLLSENRAKSVYNYLIAHSINADRLSYIGFGEAYPIATNDTPEGRAQNRRTEMKIVGK